MAREVKSDQFFGDYGQHLYHMPPDPRAWHQVGCKCQDDDIKTKEECDSQIDLARKARTAELRSIYNGNQEVKKLADQIHHSRMLPGPACNSCIEMAIAKINKLK